MADTPQSIAVIGAGIIGINCAIALQEKGFYVTLIDKDGVGEGCSKGNAGHFATEQVFPLADPALLVQLPKMLVDPLGPIAIKPSYFFKVLPWFLRFCWQMKKPNRQKNTKALQALNEGAIAAYDALLTRADAKQFLTANGSLVVYEDTPFDTVAKEAKKYQDAGIAVQHLTKEQTLALEPNLADSITQSLFFTDVGHTINPYQLSLSLFQYAKSLGVHFEQAQVTALKEHQEKVELRTTQGNRSFDKVVVSTGIDSKNVLNKLGYKLPLEAERGYHLELFQEAKLSRPIASGERKFIMTPMSQGLRLAGTVEFAGQHATANWQRATMLYQHAKAVLKETPLLPASVDESALWMGCRPSLPDSLPVIGKATKHKQLYFALGHQHLGLTLGAITGKLIGQIVSGEQPELDIRPYCISRFN
ncbi:NAD(P)/FAD-dependent oxidoreductase [Thalassotalea agarivorans]|uniref:D-amino-acid dehydrogenase n=1 Tax=Thalassotalea agarivorans TaxID=349064 RepID=A0A1I0ACV2_THASX|nr:FAD-binding oxidoreductase [Thalassotalea agarivorans]SES91999.1 D-amino-acid dehydrogenase [Thalassotalea agarivorans]